jgi:hypothetical protein
MIIGHRLLAPLCLTAALALSGCGELRRSMGYDKSTPDEFQVVERAPLALPPDFSLRPPDPGAPRPQESSMRDQARTALVGQGTRPQLTAGRTAGEAALLRQAGADQAQADIRQVVNRETSALIDADRSFTDRLVFWRAATPPGEAVDPEKEQQRLRQAQALGRSVTEGDTPVIKRRQRGLLEGIF